MAQPKTTDADFIQLFETVGPQATQRKLGTTLRNVYARRERIKGRLGRQLTAGRATGRVTRVGIEHPHRVQLDVQDGIVLVGSDAHLWPGKPTTAFRGFVKFCKDYKPRAVILNGDVMDFPQVSRHPPIGWENHPTVQQEIEAAQDKLSLIEKAAFRAEKIWTLGNHDGRFETRLATVAPEYARLHGFHLKDFFPHWRACWAVWINDVVVKHRYKGGQGATRANTLNSGKSMVTGHLHSAKVTPLTDYNGTRYGVDTGCLADPDHSAFVDYTEDSPKDWRSGFAVLTFRKGVLLQPELALVYSDDHIQFRGDVIKV